MLLTSSCFVIAALLTAVKGVSQFYICLAPVHADSLLRSLSSLSSVPSKYGVRCLKNLIRTFTNMDDDSDDETLTATAKNDPEDGPLCAVDVAVSTLSQSAVIALNCIHDLQRVRNLNVSVWAMELHEKVSSRVRRHGILDRTIETTASFDTRSSISTHSNQANDRRLAHRRSRSA